MRISGLVSDSESAVKKALGILSERYYWMCNIHCQAHAFNNLLKVRCGWVSARCMRLLHGLF